MRHRRAAVFLRDMNERVEEAEIFQQGAPKAFAQTRGLLKTYALLFNFRNAKHRIIQSGRRFLRLSSPKLFRANATICQR